MLSGIADGAISVVLLLLILVVLVVVHEFGHFFTARLAGVRVHEFGIGFPPRARVLGRDHETEYTLNWLPIGGFVRLEGEEGESDDPRAFVRAPLRTRLVILFAGVVMNILLAWLIFSLIAGFADPVATVRIDTVQPDSPAAQAGLVPGRQTGTAPDGTPTYDESGDLVLAIDGRRFAVFDRVDVPDAPLRYLREHAGQTVTLTVRRADGTHDVRATLRPAAELTPQRGALGVGLRLQREDIQRDPLSALAIGAARTLDAATLVLRGLGQLVTNITNPPVAGPIGIAGAVGAVRSPGFPPTFLLWFIGLLSANLAVVNVLPFPPMDGGRIAISLAQAVTGNRISLAVERAIYLTGFVLLMALLVWISYFDIQRLSGGS